MTIQEMNERKAELGYTNERISELSGVSISTVQRVLSGSPYRPRYETREALESVLRVGEEAVSYKAKRRGDYTLKDYYALPEDIRAELIDGQIFIMEAPTNIHQYVLSELVYLLNSHIKSHDGDCMVFPAPCDVQLDCDDRTMVEPDIVVVCDRRKVRRKVVYGAPDLIMEITSPSTRSRDMSYKVHKYQSAGVREYWIIEPDRKRVLVYDFAGKDFLSIYGFGTAVPVRIYGGECLIDFQVIYDNMRFMYEEAEDEEE